MKIKNIIPLLLLAWCVIPLSAQTDGGDAKPHKKAWEFGLGGTVYQFNRSSVSDFAKLSDGSYTFKLKLSNPVWGGNLYIARELSKHFYLDLQGSVGYAGKTYENDGNNNWLYTAGLGLQWRLGEYFGSKYIDPYLRIGAGYMYKGFDIQYVGTAGLSPDEMKWVLNNLSNKDGADRRNLIPISAGAGVNMWLNDRWGIGLQADYVAMPYKDVANSVQGTARIMYRLGGKSKKAAPVSAPVIQYVEKPVEVERIVEKVVEVEKLVEVPGKEKVLFELFSNINFDFDKATLTSESEKVIDQIADIIRKDIGDKFLISGFTDSRGSQEYNKDLSERRARAVVDALVKRGVSKNILKARGGGKNIAIANTDATDIVRRGDRKVTIEIINNQEYWDYISKKLY